MKSVCKIVIVALAMVVFVVLAGGLPGSRVFAQEVDSGEARPIVWMEDAGYFGGAIRAFDVGGAYLYTVAGMTLNVVNISDPTNPVTTLSMALPSLAADIAVENGLVYVGTVKNGLQIVDVWKEGGPAIVGVWGTGEFVDRLTVLGNRVYATVAKDIYIIDISTSTAPVLLGVYTDLYASVTAPEVVANLMFVPVVQSNCSAGSPGCESYLRIVDVSNPAAPTLLSSWTQSEAFIYQVAVYNGYAYVVDHRRNLHILDFSNPASPTLVSGWSSTPPRAMGVAVIDGSLVVAASNSGTDTLLRYSLTNPTDPQILWQYFPQGSWISYDPQLIISDGNGKAFYMAGVTASVQIVSLTETGESAYLAAYSAIGFVEPFVLQDPYLYVLAGGDFYVLSSDLPLAVTPLAILRSQADPYYSFVVSGDYAYLAGDDKVDIVSLSDPTNPQVTGSWVADPNAFPRINSVYVQGHTLYALESTKLFVIDVTNPAQPILAGTLDISSAAGAFTYGNYLYIYKYSGAGPVQIVDASVPSNPQVVAEYNAPSGSFVSLGSTLFIGSYGTFHLVDMTTPLAPVTRVSVPMPMTQPATATQHGNLLYVIVYGPNEGSISIFDLSNGNEPTFAGRHEISGRVIAVNDDRAYVSTGHDGLYGLRVNTMLATDSLYLPSLLR